MMNKLKLFSTNKMNFLSIGLISLTVGILRDKFGSDVFLNNVFAGFFMGLSVPLNIWGIYRASRSTKIVKEG